MTERQKEWIIQIIGWTFIIGLEVGWILFLFYFYDDLFIPVWDGS